MLLVIDLGNTNLTLGLYEGPQHAQPGSRWRLATDHSRMPDEYGLQFLGLLQHAGHLTADLDGICLSSVVPPLTNRVVQACQQYLHHQPMLVDSDLKTGVEILYDDPKAVGSDRIADAVAVYTQYGGPACVIDYGTATTFNALTADGKYLGGAIAAGVGIAAEALFQRGARLPRVSLKHPPSVIGRNTPNAIQSGILSGYAAMTEGMVARFRKELGEDMKVIATGGLAELIAEETDVIDILSPWLTLDGLRLIWEMNQ